MFKDISVIGNGTIKLAGIISSDIEKAANQYIISLLTRSASDVFEQTFSPITDLGSSNISPDLETFKSAFDMAHLHAINKMEATYPNIKITLGNIIIDSGQVSVYITVEDSSSGESRTFTF